MPTQTVVFPPRPRRRPRVWRAVLVVAAFWIMCGPVLVTETTTPEGVRLLVTQRWAGTDEWEVSFFYQYPGEPWVWNYIDHDDFYWWRGRIRLDPVRHRADIYRGWERVGWFDWQHRRFHLTVDDDDEPPKHYIAGSPLAHRFGD